MDAQITLQQIGPMTLAAIAARDFVKSTDSLTMTFGSRRGNINKLVVKLNDLDLYDLEHLRISRRTFEIRSIGAVQCIDCEQLSEAVRSMAEKGPKS